MFPCFMFNECSFVLLNYVPLWLSDGPQLSIFQILWGRDGGFCCSTRGCTEANCPASPKGEEGRDKDSVYGELLVMKGQCTLLGLNLLSLLHVSKGLVLWRAWLCCVFLGDTDTKCSGQKCVDF